MKYILSFAAGVLLGAGILIWGPQPAQSAGDAPAAVAHADGEVQCPYLPGKMNRIPGSSQGECPYLSGRMDQSAANAHGECPYLQGLGRQSAGSDQAVCPYLQKRSDQRAGSAYGECPYLQGGKGQSDRNCPFRDGKAGKDRASRVDDARDVRI